MLNYLTSLLTTVYYQKKLKNIENFEFKLTSLETFLQMRLCWKQWPQRNPAKILEQLLEDLSMLQ